MVISVFSPKGGIGKTSITLALANAMAEEYKTCVVEFDFSPGDFVTILGLKAYPNVVHAITDVEGAIQTPANYKFDVIVGGMPGDYKNIEREDFYMFVDKLKSLYDYVVLDVQPGFVEFCVDVFEVSQKIILIVEDSLPVVARVNSFLDWLNTNKLADVSKFCFVVNKFATPELIYLPFIKFSIPVIASIPVIKRMSEYNIGKMRKYGEKIAKEVLRDGLGRPYFRKKTKRLVF